jgi:hypothetical protein
MRVTAQVFWLRLRAVEGCHENGACKILQGAARKKKRQRRAVVPRGSA